MKMYTVVFACLAVACGGGRPTVRPLPDRPLGQQVVLFEASASYVKAVNGEADNASRDLTSAVEGCWTRAQQPSTAGLLEVEIRKIEPDGAVRPGSDNFAHIVLFEDHFAGKERGDVERALHECIDPWLERAKLPGVSSAAFRFRLLPARREEP